MFTGRFIVGVWPWLCCAYRLDSDKQLECLRQIAYSEVMELGSVDIEIGAPSLI